MRYARHAAKAGYSSGMTCTGPAGLGGFELSVARKACKPCQASAQASSCLARRHAEPADATGERVRAKTRHRALFESSQRRYWCTRGDRSVMRVNTAFAAYLDITRPISRRWMNGNAWRIRTRPTETRCCSPWTEHNLRSAPGPQPSGHMLVRIPRQDGRDRQVRVSKVGIGKVAWRCSMMSPRSTRPTTRCSRCAR